MPQCAVAGCNNTHRKTKGGTVRYHRFPGDTLTRTRWLQLCGKTLNSCASARICSRHFTESNYERDVQHELLGLPVRCRLKRGAVPDINLPQELVIDEPKPVDSAIAVLLAVGLVPNSKTEARGLPEDSGKMQIVEDVREGSDVNPPSSPGHAEERGNKITNGEILKEKVEYRLNENGHGTENNGHSGDTKEETPEKPDIKTETEDKDEKKPETENNEKNFDNCSNSSSENNKRKIEDVDDTPLKRLRSDIEDQYTVRDALLNEEITECNGLDQIITYSEQILAEIKTLNDLAREKEREWNHLIYMKKLKEELLIRLQRKRQILLLNESNIGELPLESLEQSSLLKSHQKSNMFKMTNFEKSIPSSVLAKPSQMDFNSALDFRQKPRPILDVQSIIADYRQRHPESVPRRGRRIRQSQGIGQKDADYASEVGMILNHMNGNKSKSFLSDDCSEITSYKDVLVEFNKLSEKEKDEVRIVLKKLEKPPPPYPEVTVHPVATTNTVGPTPTNSLLHGILTKSPTRPPSHQKMNTIASPLPTSKSALSPCLARLLTAPERSAMGQATSTPAKPGGHITQGNNTLISEILSNTKARNEITITPVSGYESSSKNELGEDLEEGPDRLVIDENSDMYNSSGKTDSSDIEEVPQCQGCNQKAALFVCAGCGNQWYCSRDCQVEAWDEHSEVCSG